MGYTYIDRYMHTWESTGCENGVWEFLRVTHGDIDSVQIFGCLCTEFDRFSGQKNKRMDVFILSCSDFRTKSDQLLINAFSVVVPVTGHEAPSDAISPDSMCRRFFAVIRDLALETFR